MKKPTNKRPGGGGKASKPATPDKMDSAAENFPQCTEATASTKEPAKPKHKNGWIHYQGRAIAKIEAESAEDYEQAKQVIEAGFRVRDEAKYWDMPPEHYWQLHNFPSDPEDWEARMQRLIEHKLGDTARRDAHPSFTQTEVRGQGRPGAAESDLRAPDYPAAKPNHHLCRACDGRIQRKPAGCGGAESLQQWRAGRRKAGDADRKSVV